MANQTGQKNQALITGRIIYGYDGADAYPLKVDSNGQIVPTLTKTIQTELLAITSIAASTQVTSTTLALTGMKKITIFIDHARAGSAAFGTNGTEYRVEASQKAAGNETWRALASVVAASAVAMTAAASGNYAAGAGTITILSGTAMVLGDIYFWINGAAASCEWMKVRTITGTASFRILDELTNAQAAASALVGGAEQFALVMNVATATRLRVIVNNNASGSSQAIYSRIGCITES